MKTFYSCYKRKLSSWSPTLGVSEKHQEMNLPQSQSNRNNVFMCINPFPEMYVKHNRAQIKSKAVVEPCGVVAVVLEVLKACNLFSSCQTVRSCKCFCRWSIGVWTHWIIYLLDAKISHPLAGKQNGSTSYSRTCSRQSTKRLIVVLYFLILHWLQKHVLRWINGLIQVQNAQKMTFTDLKSHWLHDVSVIWKLACQWLRRERREEREGRGLWLVGWSVQ